jgi:type I restriction enzyme S subunit
MSVPPGWSKVRLGALLREPLRNGHSAKASDDGSGVPTLTLTAVTYGQFTPENLKFTVADPLKVQDLWLAPEDLLIERSNTPELVGTTALFPGPKGFAIFPDLIIRARVHCDLSARYIAAFLKSEEARKYFRQRAQGIAGSMPKIDQGAVEGLIIPLAPRSEQDRIVAAIEQHLSDIDAGVAALERILANLKRYRASVLKAACEGRLLPTEAELARKEGRDYEPADVLLRRILKERRARWEADQLAKMKAKGQEPRDDRWKAKYEEPKGPETRELPELPEGWVWTTVETAGDIVLGRRRAPEYVEGQDGRVMHPYVRAANVRRTHLDLSDLLQMPFNDQELRLYRLQPGDIILVEGHSAEWVGMSAIYTGGVGNLCIQATVHRFRPRPGAVSTAFAQTVFRYHLLTGIFQRAASLTVNIAHLTSERLKPLPFPLPPEREQARIVAEVDRLLSVADETEQTVRAQLARAERLRQAVLKRAFEGKLVPQDPNDEPASVLLERIRGAHTAAAAEPGKPRGRATRATRAKVTDAPPEGGRSHA